MDVPPGIAAQIRAEGGRVTFARFMELALTHPAEGYYSRRETLLGPRGDYTTAPVLSPEFNETVSRLVEEVVVSLVRTHEGVLHGVRIVELGGGEGQLAKALLGRLSGEHPHLKAQLVYNLVEVGEALRARQRAALARPLAAGWRVTWASTLADALAEALPTVVVGNEFVDALPVHLVEVRGQAAREAWVEVTGGGADVARGAGRRERLREDWDALGPEAAAELRTLFGTEDASVLRAYSKDGVIEVRPAAQGLVQELARSRVHDSVRGLKRAAPEARVGDCLLTIDYGEWFGDSSAGRKPAPYRRTVRGYFRHQLVSDLYARAGAQDLTADVDFRALDLHGRDAGLETVLYTTVAAMLRGDRGLERLEKLEKEAGSCLEADRRASALRALLDDESLGQAFKVMLQVSG